MAEVPEKEMFLKMWPGGKQPVTRKPVVTRKGHEIIITCATRGASIAYLISSRDFRPGLNAGWQVYHKPIRVPRGKYLYVMAQRIGYKESPVVRKDFLKGDADKKHKLGTIVE